MSNDNEVSLNQALNLVKKFASCVDKTQAVWIGARRDYSVEYKMSKPI